jgi:hypothetical protein
MYKLKCIQCDHLNEVNSEYLTFCSNCNSKLNNSFQEWTKKNRTKSFEDYKLEVCIDEEIQLERIRAFKKRNRKWNIKLFVALLIVSVVIGTTFTLYHFKMDDLLDRLGSLNWTTNGILTKEWEKKAYYDLHFFLETPYKPDTITLLYPAEVKSIILSTAAYTINENAGAFGMLMNYVEYNPNIPLSFDDAIQGSINSMENQPGVTDLSSSLAPYAIKDHEASMVNGTLKKYGVPFKFHMLVFSGEHQLSQIIVEFHEDDEEAEKASERIFKSLKIL